MTYALRILSGAVMAWLRDTEQQINNHIGRWLCPRRYK